MVHLKHASSQAIIGATSAGFKFKVDSSSFNNAELTIKDNNLGSAIGINTNPIDNYMVNVNGDVNATQYLIKDQWASGGYRLFQSVPTGVIMLWVDDTLPANGWKECVNTTNNCVDLRGHYVKGMNANYSNIKHTGGVDKASLSSVHHSHNRVKHSHKLNAGGHRHDLVLNNKNINTSTSSSNGYTTNKLGGEHYTVLKEQGSHTHLFNQSHGHNIANKSHAAEFGGGTHDHGNTGENEHGHDTSDSADGGKAHGHTLDNKPDTHIVRFLIKVDET